MKGMGPTAVDSSTDPVLSPRAVFLAGGELDVFCLSGVSPTVVLDIERMFR